MAAIPRDGSVLAGTDNSAADAAKALLPRRVQQCLQPLRLGNAVVIEEDDQVSVGIPEAPVAGGARPGMILLMKVELDAARRLLLQGLERFLGAVLGSVVDDVELYLFDAFASGKSAAKAAENALAPVVGRHDDGYSGPIDRLGRKGGGTLYNWRVTQSFTANLARYLFTNAARTGGGLYLLDTATGEMERVLEGSFRGLTEGGDGCLYVVSGYRNPAEDVSILHRIERDTWRSEVLATHPVKDSHDLRWNGDGFYLVASVGNRILRLDRQGALIDSMQVVEDDRDICHVNCLTSFEDQLYCAVFTLSPGDRESKRLTGAWHTEGKILRVDWEAKSWEIAYEPLAQPHSLLTSGEGLVLVESHKARVVALHREFSSAKVLGQYSGFLRGLSVASDEALIGVSTMYDKDRRRLRPLPMWHRFEERYRPFSGLLLVDPKTWRIRRRFPLAGAQVYDIHRLTD